MRLRLTPVTLIYIITSTYYNSTFDLLLKDAETHKFGRKTEPISHAPMRSTASSSSHITGGVTFQTAVLLLRGTDLNKNLDQ